jgi:hypothetical protein
MVENHVLVPPEEWPNVDLPKPEEMPNVDMQIVVRRRVTSYKSHFADPFAELSSPRRRHLPHECALALNPK